MKYDIIIVGGGVAGYTMALALRDTGLKIAIIEANPPATGNDSCSLPERMVALSGGSSIFLDRLGVWSEVRDHASAIEKVYVSEPGQSGTVCMKRDESCREALGYVLELPLLVRTLCRKADQYSDIFCPALVTGMVQEADHIRIDFQQKERKKRVSAALVIGADGTYSKIRSLAGITTFGWDHNRFGLVASVRPQRPHSAAAFECFRSSGPLALLPLDDARCTIVWILGPEEACRQMDMDDDCFLTSLGRAIGSNVRSRLGRMLETGPRACFPLELRLARRLTGQRLALIGNAAHTLHPVAGQGLNLGLRDVETMADILVRATGDGRDVGGGIVLEEYSDRRRLDHAALTGFTEGMNLLFGNQCTPLQLLRGLGLDSLQKISPARDWLQRHAAGIA